MGCRPSRIEDHVSNISLPIASAHRRGAVMDVVWSVIWFLLVLAAAYAGGFVDMIALG